MRIKFLAVIVSFIFVSLAITSCLDTNDDAIDYSSDATIHAFGLDTIHGKHYRFSIDQLSRLIYNADSLPVGSDTIINHILIDTLSVTGWVTSGLADTILNINDSVDFRQPITLKVHAADAVSTSQYTVKVNVHKQDPDSLIWTGDMEDISIPALTGKQKSVILHGDQLLVYTSNTSVYKSSTQGGKCLWDKVASVTNLPADAKLTSVVNFQEKLYMATGSGKVFRSADGLVWEEVKSLSNGKILTLVNSFANTLVGIQNADGKKSFCTTTSALSWTMGDEVPEGFPLEDIYSTAYANATGVVQAVVTGNTPEVGKATVPWFSLDGAGWASLATTSDAYCPGMVNPAILHYGGSFYIWGGDFKTIYHSFAGIAWYKTKKKFLLPKEFKEKGAYSMTIDKNNYIWIIWGGKKATTLEVWRGRLNKLGFAKQ